MQPHRLSELSKILTWVWLALALPGPVVGAFIGLDQFWVINLVANLVILIGGWWLQNEFYGKGLHHLFLAWRKFVGYGIVVGYCLVNIASLSWDSEIMWYISAVQGLVGWLLWVCLRIKSTERHYGYTPPAKGTKKTLGDATLENIDIVIQTLFLVVVLQQLFFQLYVIPSESMVPTLLKNDRPLVIKSFDGPEIPMSKFKLPAVAPVNRGQIIVFETPVYDEPPVITQMIQKLVFFLTLSNVNLDVDAEGKAKVQFVVKRVTGVPGEKLMMVDDQLYHKTAADTTWSLVAEDAGYRHVDLWKEPAETLRQIDKVLFRESDRQELDRLDAERSSTDLEVLRNLLTTEVERLRKALASPSVKSVEGLTASMGSSLSYLTIPNLGKTPESLVASLAAPSALPAEASLYQRAARYLNLVFKRAVVETYLARLEGWGEADVKLLVQRKNDLERQLRAFDLRNFPEFPAGAGNYIPEGSYFLMGDNRYGSLDFRYDALQTTRTLAIDDTDATSMVRDTILAPRLLPRKYIIGHLAFRLWPLDKILVN